MRESRRRRQESIQEERIRQATPPPSHSSLTTVDLKCRRILERQARSAGGIPLLRAVPGRVPSPLPVVRPWPRRQPAQPGRV